MYVIAFYSQIKLCASSLSLPLFEMSTVSFLIWLSYVARPLSYKTKTTYFFKTKPGQAKTKTAFSRPRSLFLKTIKLLTQDHWHSQKF